MLTPPSKVYRFHDDEGKFLVGRDVFVAAFFTRDLYTAAADAASLLLSQWLLATPQTLLEWVQVGPNSSQYKPYSTAMTARCKTELSTAKARRDLGFFTIRGGEDCHNPSYEFTFIGENTPGGMAPDATCLVELRWPSEHVARVGFDEIASQICNFASLIPFRSGYASPALSLGWENAEHVAAGAMKIAPIAFRHPGYDIPENHAAAGLMRRDRCRGARWLTFLGSPLVEDIGGLQPLQEHLDPRVGIIELPHGVMLRAGHSPEIGDVNRGESTPLLRSVASAIEPITEFETAAIMKRVFNEDASLRWERRHLD